METGIWLSPLLLMPGAALLILSTSARYAQIHNEIHHVLEESHGHGHVHIGEATINQLMKRSVLFKKALVMLYTSVMFLSTAGLAGAVASQINEEFTFLSVTLLSGIGIACIVLASVFLIRESIDSLDIIKDHYAEIKEKHSK